MSDFMWPTRYPRARKEHVCGECWRTIRVGETYARHAGMDDGNTWNAIVCAHCEVVAEHFVEVDGEVLYGGVGETLEYAETYKELRFLLGMRKKWTRKDGTLMNLPTNSTAIELAGRD